MKTKILGLLICLIPALSCNRNDMIKIYGKVSIGDLNGSFVYVITASGAGGIAEDSAMIRNNSFTLRLPADTLKIRTLRIVNHSSSATEDLIFIKEPGTLNVVMGANSKSSGSRLNDILMDWKKGNIGYDSVQYDLDYQAGAPGISASVRDSLVRLSTITDSLYMKKITDLLDWNLDNGIGMFLFGVYYDNLPLETRKRILGLKGNEYMQHDLSIWSKVMFDRQIPKQNSSVN